MDLNTYTYSSPSGTTKHLVILAHGLGADGQDLIGLADELAHYLPDTTFISPDAPFSCDMAPYGRQWFSLQSRAEADLEREVKTAQPILNAYIDAKLEEYQLTIDKLALIGFSQGTMTSLYTALRREDSVAGIVGFSGAMVAATKLPREVQSKPPVCLIHGDADPVVPFESMAIAERSLKAADIAVETHRRPGLPHGIDPQGLKIAGEFLQKHLISEYV
jgi:phospholipase/carboxylesterase